jgi:hypothetical protein
LPSSSKKQARAIAWAAHSKEGARKLGISQEKAREWAKADERAGTMKKKPERKR